MIIKRTAILSIAICIFSASNYAQVTIGSDKPAVAGSLLDIKDGTTASDPLVNANRGLLLPRVVLKDKNALTMGDNVIENINTVWKDHAGLLVYNTEPLMEGTVCPTLILNVGLQVWDGSAWQGLDPLPDDSGVDQTNWVGDLTTGVGVLTDYEGNTYPTKRFNMNGTDAGIWTTVSSYSTRDRNGKLLVGQKLANGTIIEGGARLNPAYESTSKGAVPICTIADLADDLSKVPYGEGTESNPALNYSVTRKEFVKIFGLSYLWNQAQVICPTGWHLPSLSDWENLRLAHGQGTVIDDSGAAMRKNRDYYHARDASAYKWGSDSETDAFSGFDAVPSGLVRSDGLALYFSRYIYLWCSTSENRDVFINSTQSILGFTTSTSDIYESVRCVKD